MAPVSWEAVRRGLQRHPPGEVQGTVASRAAVALVLREGEAGLELLFIHRAEHPEDPWSGHMAFPGGRREPSDPDLLATAVRETREEIGLDLEAAERLGRMDEIRAMARGRPVDLAITPFVFRLTRTVEVTIGPEVRGVHWMPLDVLLAPECRSTFDYDHEGTRMGLPCLRLQERVIWGLTLRMFDNLQSLLGTGD